MELLKFWKKLFKRWKKKFSPASGSRVYRIPSEKSKKTRVPAKKKLKKRPLKKAKKKPLKKAPKKTKPKIKKIPKKKVKKPLKKTAPKPAVKKLKEKEIGVITHHFGKISVGIIKLKSELRVGDKIHIEGAHDDFSQTIKSMQINHKDVSRAKKGDEIGIKVTRPVHENDKVYKAPPT